MMRNLKPDTILIKNSHEELLHIGFFDFSYACPLENEVTNVR